MTVAKMKWDENHERHFLARLMHWSAVQILVLPNSLIIISVMWYEREYGCSCWEEHDSTMPFLCFSLLCCTSMERVCQKNCRKWPVVSDQFFLITFKKKIKKEFGSESGGRNFRVLSCNCSDAVCLDRQRFLLSLLINVVMPSVCAWLSEENWMWSIQNGLVRLHEGFALRYRWRYVYDLFRQGIHITAESISPIFFIWSQLMFYLFFLLV